MAKIILISVIFATVAIPAFFAGDRQAKRGLKKTVTWTIVFLAAWVFFCVFFATRML